MLALLFAAIVVVQDTTPPARPAQPARLPADAAADTGTANLIARARARRQRAERLVTSYEATVTQRMGVGMRALRRDRMVFNQQMSARILWRRDSTSVIRMTGARQSIPVAIAGVHIPQALVEQAQFLAFDPSEDYLRLIGNDPEGLLFPLADSALARYRYAPGDTTYITLPSGREIRLVELRITPRRPEFRLLTGSMWFDADTWGVVRMVVRPSRAFDLELDGDSGDADDVPGVLKPIRFDIQYITFEYGLYEARWWLPRLMALDGELSMGSFLRSPARFERVYDVQSVTGGGEPPVAERPRWRAGGRGPNMDSIVQADSLRFGADSIASIVARCVTRDSTEVAEHRARRDSARAAGGRGRVGVQVDVRVGVGACVRRSILEGTGQPWRADVTVDVPEDTMALLNSPDLGPPILDMGDIISERELRSLGEAIGALPSASSLIGRRLAVGRWRYNRVEALSAEVSRSLPLGRVQLDARFRLGIADLEPNAEVAVLRPDRGLNVSGALYRRLVSVDPPTRTLGAGNSINALLFGRDDGDYYRTAGAEIRLEPGSAHSRWAEVRLFAEHQSAANKETDISLVRAFDSSRRFRPNITAAAADQFGGALILRGFRTFSPGFGVGADVALEGQTGTFDVARSTLTVRGTAPLIMGFTGGFEAAAGATTRAAPPQSLFYIGGPETLRGYGGNALRGETFWRGRGELALGFPAVRLALFSDAAWAGPRAMFDRGRPLVSGGIGVSILDGLLRVDVSRAMRAGRLPAVRGWRFDVYADGVL